MKAVQSVCHVDIAFSLFCIVNYLELSVSEVRQSVQVHLFVHSFLSVCVGN